MLRIATATGLFLVALGAVLRFWSGGMGGAQGHTVGDITMIAGAGSLLVAVVSLAGVRAPSRRSKQPYQRGYLTDASYAQNPHYAEDSRYAQNPRYCQDPRYTVDD